MGVRRGYPPQGSKYPTLRYLPRTIIAIPIMETLNTPIVRCSGPLGKRIQKLSTPVHVGNMVVDAVLVLCCCTPQLLLEFVVFSKDVHDIVLIARVPQVGV